MYIRRWIMLVIPLLLAVVAMLVGWSIVNAQLSDVVVTVSPFKGAPGTLVTIPIYASDISDYEVTNIEVGLRADPKILQFSNITMTAASILGFAGGSIDQNLRTSQIDLRFDNPYTITAQGTRILFAVQYTVTGEAGQIGLIDLNHFSFGKGKEPNFQLQDGEFRILPTAQYFGDRDFIEIVDSKVFTSFELKVSGEIDFTAQEVSGWSIEQNGNLISGFALNADGGATAVSIPMTIDKAVDIYSLKIGNSKVIRFLDEPAPQRQLLIPYLFSN